MAAWPWSVGDGAVVGHAADAAFRVGDGVGDSIVPVFALEMPSNVVGIFSGWKSANKFGCAVA